MDIGWIELFRIALVGIATFFIAIFIKPLILGLRDFIVIWLVSKYFEASKFHARAQLMAKQKATFNSKYSGKASYDFKNGIHVHTMNEKECSPDEFKEFIAKGDQLRKEIFNLSYRLDNEVHIIKSCLKHYGNNGLNPGQKIIQRYEKREYEKVGLNYPNEP